MRELADGRLRLDEPAPDVARLTIANPAKRNALDQEILDAIASAVRGLDARCVVLTGSGGMFSAGYDIGDIPSQVFAEEAERLVAHPFAEAIDALDRYPYPTVAALNGHAIGGGLEVALSCDLRIASESCKITTAFAKVGFSGDYGGTYFLTQLLGSARARELYLMSPVLTAKEAHAIGMVTKVVPDAEIDTAAHELAMSLAQGPSIALGFIKRNINNAEHLALEDCFDGEAIHHTRCSDTEDHKEAAKAFVEKRKPTFKGA